MQECRSADNCENNEVMSELQDSRTPELLTFNQKLDILEEQLRINVEMIDEQRGILHTRRHLAATPIFKGIPNFRPIRIAMLRATHMNELIDILEQTRTLLA